MSGDYILDSGTDLGERQLGYLERLLDGHSAASLAGTGIGPGWRCLDLGAGSGSMAYWMARQVAPDGSVVAVDVDTGRMTPAPGVEIVRHDVTGGLPVPGPFDVIHARLLLMHLPQRLEILRTLVDALAPGGWLVLGEFSGLNDAIETPTPEDAELYVRVRDTAENTLGRPAGVDYDWLNRAETAMTAAGLTEPHTAAHRQTAHGGEPACRLIQNYVDQVRTPLIATGIPPTDLDRFATLMLDPRFRTWFYDFHCIRARKPLST